jgi:hypothetical protein
MGKLKEIKKLVDDNLELLMKVFIISFIITMFLRCGFDIINSIG